MTRAGLLVLFVASIARADTLPDPGRASSVPGVDGAPVKVERRVLVKQGRAFVGAGPTVLERRDYYSYPGVTASAAYYPSEQYAFEARVSGFVPFLNPGAREILETRGTVPDAQQVRSIFAVGGRMSVAYGKVALMPALGRVLHFDVQLTAHAALAFTHTPDAPPAMPRSAVNPTLLAGPALLMRVSDRLHLQLDLPVVAGYEARTRGIPVALGFLPVLGAGVRL